MAVDWYPIREFQSAPSRGEGDLPSAPSRQISQGFNPRPPVGRATRRRSFPPTGQGFQSAPSRGEGDVDTLAVAMRDFLFQSAPSRGEGDGALPRETPQQGVSIRALPWGGRRHPPRTLGKRLGFNPRPPVGRATSWKGSQSAGGEFQSAPSRGEGDGGVRPLHDMHLVSIRALPWGGRPAGATMSTEATRFQSAPSRGEGDRALVGHPRSNPVSIRALPWGGRPRRSWRSPAKSGFNPRPPVGRATAVGVFHSEIGRFQSAPSRGEGDEAMLEPRRKGRVSIRALPWGGRLMRTSIIASTTCFNPRPPVGRATSLRTIRTSRTCFNPRPPVGRATSCRPCPSP